MNKIEPQAGKHGTDWAVGGEAGRVKWYKAGEGASQRTCMNDSWTMERGLTMGEMGRLCRGGKRKKRNWKNCNRINNKNINLKRLLSSDPVVPVLEMYLRNTRYSESGDLCKNLLTIFYNSKKLIKTKTDFYKEDNTMETLSIGVYSPWETL